MLPGFGYCTAHNYLNCMQHAYMCLLVDKRFYSAFTNTVVSRKGPMGGMHFMQTKGWADICNIAAFHHGKAPMFTLYHNLQQDIAHQHTRPVLLAAVMFWIAGGDASFEFTGTVCISRSNEPKCA